ncbi:hypothetical protein C8J57DRAFT_1482533 [Mycena rebaudengoi]|nr:hypothetical protein C8J57DRAFT_1482533 [Mycena rebaudengoi]
MALSRFAFMPPELKIMTYYEFDPLDLLSVSHVSSSGGLLRLKINDGMLGLTKFAHQKGETAEHLLARYKLAGSISKRTVFAFAPTLSEAVGTASSCRKCLDLPEHAVISFSSALATYDLKERDIGDALVVAIKKYGGEANMTTHLEQRKPPSESHTKSGLLEYKTAHEKRVQLQTSGNVVGAAMVGMGKNNKKMTKAPPVMPAILKNSSTPSFLRRFALFSTNYLSVENGLVVPRPLNRSEEFKQWTGQTIEPKYPGPLPRALLALHEQHEHHGREGPVIMMSVPIDERQSRTTEYTAQDLRSTESWYQVSTPPLPHEEIVRSSRSVAGVCNQHAADAESAHGGALQPRWPRRPRKHSAVEHEMMDMREPGRKTNEGGHKGLSDAVRFDWNIKLQRMNVGYLWE